MECGGALATIPGKASFVQVRHGAHTWHIGASGKTVTDEMQSWERYPRTPSELLPSWVVTRYRAIQIQLNRSVTANRK
ncbi:MAG: hypothetical protein NVSMB52_08370 [Chloroflexota bacterium]